MSQDTPIPPPPAGNLPPPPSQPFPGSLTPGWNDPPPLQLTDSNRPRTKLNKRVPFPLSQQPVDVSRPTAVVGPNTSASIAVVHPMPIIPSDNPLGSSAPPPFQGLPGSYASAAPSCLSQSAVPPGDGGNPIPILLVPPTPRQTTTHVGLDNEASVSTIQHL